MEEIETPIENIQETINETAHHSQESWVGKVALFSAVIAVIAAIAALLAGHHSNEAMITQIKASDSWSFYQAKGIKAGLLQSKMQLLAQLGKPEANDDQEKLSEYKKQQDEISEKAKELEHESAHHLQVHEVMARAVTLFQVTIAIAAITILTKKRKILYLGYGFSLLAIIFFIQALLMK